MKIIHVHCFQITLPSAGEETIMDNLVLETQPIQIHQPALHFLILIRLPRLMVQLQSVGAVMVLRLMRAFLQKMILELRPIM